MEGHQHDPDAHHVHCLDLYNLGTTYEHDHRRNGGPFDVLCRVPVDKGHGMSVSPSVALLPGVDALDFYATSEHAEIWKNGATTVCLMPQEVIGWEFYSLLWTQPDGTVPLRLGESVELLIGRRPGEPLCPSILFAYVPKGHAYPQPGHSAASTPGARQRAQPLAPSQGGATRSAYKSERQSYNLDEHGHTRLARLVVLSPQSVYNNAALLPDDPNWGLFIGPRSRSLVLLNKQRGRIDLNLATLLSVDAAFLQCRALIEATSRLFEPFGSRERVPDLFGDMHPLNVHSGLTNAIVPDHMNVSSDGRADYMHTFNVRLPTFFVSNASANTCFLTPLEAQFHRTGGKISQSSKVKSLPQPIPLPDMPSWTVTGPLDQEGQKALHEYRMRHPLRASPHATSGSGEDHGWLSSLFGLDHRVGGWLSSIGGCIDVVKASGEGGHPHGENVEVHPLPANHDPRDGSGANTAGRTEIPTATFGGVGGDEHDENHSSGATPLTFSAVAGKVPSTST
mmetsp:Transcript_928/g.2274  ORF Transcript_928/g.2274 Transcript_928/m.2274 type:complete len:509 (-) Transcript_928:21-1547(-)